MIYSFCATSVAQNLEDIQSLLHSTSLDGIVFELCNIALMKNDKPNQWTLCNIIPVPKKGDLSKTDNYRGIGLMCIITKLYNCMILSTIQTVLEPQFRSNQKGFRPNRTTVAQILALRHRTTCLQSSLSLTSGKHLIQLTRIK